MLNRYKYLIIGGGIAGTTAAETIRQYDKEGTVAIIGHESHRLYSRIVLSKPEFYKKNGIPNTLFLKKPEWYKTNNIDLLCDETVIKLDKDEKYISLISGKVLGYERLLLAVGVEPSLLPESKFSEDRRILSLHNLDQAREIQRQLTDAETVVVVGGGFIAIELCDLLIKLKKKVVSVIASPRYWRSTFDEISSRLVEDALRNSGVEIHTESSISEIVGRSKIEAVSVQNSRTCVETAIPCSMIISAIGTSCPLGWVKESGIKCNKGILTNEYLETGVSDVWAAGDCVEYYDVIFKRNMNIANWTNARVQGRIAAMNMIGRRSMYRKVTFYSTEKLGLSICFVGDTSRTGDDKKIITRGSYELCAYTELRIVKNRIVGATMINMTDELNSLVSLIEGEVPVEDHLIEISDPRYNLRSISYEKK